jgi:hypothetical protein
MHVQLSAAHRDELSTSLARYVKAIHALKLATEIHERCRAEYEATLGRLGVPLDTEIDGVPTRSR